MKVNARGFAFPRMMFDARESMDRDEGRKISGFFCSEVEHQP